MNVQRLKEIVDQLLRMETELNIQGHLSSLNQVLSAFASAPQEASHQIEVANRLHTLTSQLNNFVSRYDSPHLQMLDEIGALYFFGPDISFRIRTSITDNPMTPAVVQQMVQKLSQEREQYLAQLRSIAAGFEAIGIESDSLAPSTAEIGFQIPRELFHNELEGLIGELRAIKFILRTFSELAIHAVEPIAVKQISTTDPLFSFAMSPATIAMIGGAITWALNTWKQLEEIRNVRAQTRKITTIKVEDTEKFFDERITATVKAAIDEKTKELVAAGNAKAGRKEELRVAVETALESLFARIERGMTVEIRFLPPPVLQAADGDQPAQKEPAEFEELRKIVPQLSFPTPGESPILQLPPPPDGEAKSTKKDQK